MNDEINGGAKIIYPTFAVFIGQCVKEAEHSAMKCTKFKSQAFFWRRHISKMKRMRKTIVAPTVCHEPIAFSFEFYFLFVAVSSLKANRLLIYRSIWTCSKLKEV